jgi:CheY-like chemotaxis protein
MIRLNRVILEGHEVRCAFDGASAVAIAQQFGPHLVLLDISLPGIDGYEVLRRLREQSGASQRKVVAVTGFGRAEDRRRIALDVCADWLSGLAKMAGPNFCLAANTPMR